MSEYSHHHYVFVPGPSTDTYSLNRFLISAYLPTSHSPIQTDIKQTSQSLLNQRLPANWDYSGGNMTDQKGLNRFLISAYLPTPALPTH